LAGAGFAGALAWLAFGGTALTGALAEVAGLVEAAFGGVVFFDATGLVFAMSFLCYQSNKGRCHDTIQRRTVKYSREKYPAKLILRGS
jgi:hypothetical protein